MGRLHFFGFLPILLFVAATTALAFPGTDQKADEQAGAILYRDKGCPQCHGPALEGNKKGPSLADIRNDKDWPPERITRQIMEGGQKMPPFGESLTDQEIAQLIAFLRAKDRPTPPAATPSN